MKAALLIKPSRIDEKPLKIKNVNESKVNENEIKVKIEECGICRFDLNLIEGNWFSFGFPRKLPLIPGHEIVGKIVEIGSSIQNFKEKETVGLSFIYETCGKCVYCLNNSENLCKNILIAGESIDGGFAEYIVCKENYLFKINEKIKDIATILLCEGSIVYKFIKYSNLSPPSKIIVFGYDDVNFIAVQIIKIFGLDVTVVSKNEELYKYGASELISLNEIKDEIYDAAFVFYPSNEVIQKALKSIKSGCAIILNVIGNISLPIFLKEKKIIMCGFPNKRDILNTFEIAKNNNIILNKINSKLENINEDLVQLKYKNKKEKIILKF